MVAVSLPISLLVACLLCSLQAGHAEQPIGTASPPERSHIARYKLSFYLAVRNVEHQSLEANRTVFRAFEEAIREAVLAESASKIPLKDVRVATVFFGAAIVQCSIYSSTFSELQEIRENFRSFESLGQRIARRVQAVQSIHATAGGVIVSDISTGVISPASKDAATTVPPPALSAEAGHDDPGSPPHLFGIGIVLGAVAGAVLMVAVPLLLRRRAHGRRGGGGEKPDEGGVAVEAPAEDGRPAGPPSSPCTTNAERESSPLAASPKGRIDVRVAGVAPSNADIDVEVGPVALEESIASYVKKLVHQKDAETYRYCTDGEKPQIGAEHLQLECEEILEENPVLCS